MKPQIYLSVVLLMPMLESDKEKQAVSIDWLLEIGLIVIQQTTLCDKRRY